MSHKEAERRISLDRQTVGFVIMLNLIPEMGDRMPTGVSWTKRGSVTDCRRYCSQTASYV